MTQAHLLAPVVLTPAAPRCLRPDYTGAEHRHPVSAHLQPGRAVPSFPPSPTGGAAEAVWPRDQQTLVLTFDDYASMLQRDSRAAGFVVDPSGTASPWTGDGGPPGPAEGRGHSTGPAGDSEGYPSHAGGPGGVPERMVEAICSAARELPAVKALYLRLMVQEGEMEPSYLVVVDQDGEQDAVFSAIAGAARPWLEGKTVDLVPAPPALDRTPPRESPSTTGSEKADRAPAGARSVLFLESCFALHSLDIRFLQGLDAPGGQGLRRGIVVLYPEDHIGGFGLAPPGMHTCTPR